MSEIDDLTRRVGLQLTGRKVRYEAKAMMGGTCFMVDDKMCVGTVKQLLMVRFDPELHEDVLARPGAGPMDFTGRPMRGYVFVKAKALQTEAALAPWIDLALAYNPKARRSAKKKPARTRER